MNLDWSFGVELKVIRNSHFLKIFYTASHIPVPKHTLSLPMAANMDVDSPKKTVLAPPGTVASVSVDMHPLVLMNISEHWTRSRAQSGKIMPGETFLSSLHNNYYC